MVSARRIVVIVFLLLEACGGGHEEHVVPAAASFQQLDLEQVKVGGEIGRRIDLAVRKNFLALDLENDFLRLFRHRRPKEQVTRNPDRFKGLGMQIHAAVQFAKYTNDTEVIARKNFLVAETIKTQSPSGYIGVFSEEPDGSQLWHEWCTHEAAYIAYGLAEDFRHFGNRPSLEASRRLADYLMANWPGRPKDPYFTTLGAAEACFSLHDLTGEQKYLRFAADEPMGKKFRILPAPLTTWEQAISLERRLTAEEIAAEPNLTYGPVDFCHTYRLFERAMMQVRLNRIEPRDNLPLMPRRILRAMTRANKPGMLITGVVGQRERWVENQDGSGRVGENCATVYELWLLDEMARLDGDLRYGDIMERALYNTFFASQDPEGRRVRYFTPFSGKREYFDRDAFCCPNNFRRGMGSLPRLVFYRSNGGVAINIYTRSEASLDLGEGVSLQVRQQTDYPSSGRVEITLTPSAPAAFPLRLRIPRWCEAARVAVNGAETGEVKPGLPYFEIRREWRPGDRVTLEMPMPPRFIKGREMQAGRAALMRGPVVFCLNPERNPGLEAVQLRDLTLDPGSLAGPFPDSSARPDGVAFRMKAWSPGRDLNEPADLTVLLTEFPDAGGEEIYFRLPDTGISVDDELFEPSGSGV